MLKTKNLITAVFTTIAIAIFAVASFAQEAAPVEKEKNHKEGKHLGKGRGEGKGHFGRHGVGRLLHQIELTEEQRARIKELHVANKPDAAVRDEMKAIHAAKRAGTITEEQKARARALREQAMLKREQLHQQVLNILTPEQRQQIETRKQEMKTRKEEHMKMKKERMAKEAEKPNN